MRRVSSSVVLSALLVGCSVFSAGPDPTPEEPPPGTPQDNAKPPPVDGSPIPGVYVSTSQGNDDGSGTPARPLKTLAKAFALANEQHLRVIACAEVYTESLTLVDGVSAYGYYECAVTPWKRGERRAIVRAPSSPAVFAKGLKLPTRLEGFEVIAPDLDKVTATETAGSSIALDVRESRELVISGTTLQGGKASPGADGEAGPENTISGGADAPPARDQTTAACNPMVALCASRTVVGGPGATTICALGAPGGPGGQGGDGRFFINGQPNTVAAEHRGRPLVASGSTAIGGLKPVSIGLPGSNGAAGTEGIDGVNGTWSVTASGFAPGNGTRGEAGGSGQGGGGGAGGCAGQPGTPATGGGASIGAFVLASSVTLDGTRVESSAGGRAGRGNLGSKGTFGNKRAVGSVVNGYVISGNGGPGGPGGNGGASGHGAAGPSIALAYSGARPIITGPELAPGQGGAGQPALQGITPLGVSRTLPAAPPGSSEREHQIQ